MLFALVLASALVGPESTATECVFSGHGAAAYDKWLAANAGEYSRLRPLSVQIDSEVAGDSGRYSYYVSFLNDTGAVVRQRAFSGVRETMSDDGRWRWIKARVSDEGDELYVCPEVGITSIYGPSGDSLFTSSEGVVDGAAGLARE